MTCGFSLFPFVNQKAANQVNEAHQKVHDAINDAANKTLHDLAR
nr:hypothetical protein [uncultured Prevotella sp.]